MLDEPATIDQSDSLVPPGSPRAGVDRQRTQPNEITADSDLTSLPYVMSRADGKRGESDPDYVPDYIDKSSIPTAEKAMVLGVDDETKQLAEEARAAAIRDGQLDEDGNPIGEKPQLEPEAEGGLDVMENIQEIVDTILKVVWAAVARPIQIVAISGSVLLLTFGLALGQSTMHVRAAEVEALSARGQFYKAIVAEQRIVDDLSALGADNTMLSSRWFAFADAEEEPTKMDAAGQLMATLSNTARILERSEGAAVRPHKVHIVRERLGRIDRVRRDYDQKMLEWDKVADSTRGRLAIRFGVAPAPD